MYMKSMIALLFLSVNTLLPRDFAEKPIAILTCSYNNAEWYRWNLDSIREQEYSNYVCLYVDDASTDGTADLVQAYIDEYGLHDRIILVRNTERKGAMYNQYTAIHTYCTNDTIVIICDGDDRLAHRGVLSYINHAYSTYDIWLSYGQFKEYPSGDIGFCSPMPVDIVARNAFREHDHIPSHLRTFYAGLFKKIEKEDLMYNGDFVQMSPDLTAMFPMIEMARDHFAFIADVLLEYNAANVLNEHKISKGLQRAIDLAIRARRRYDKIASPF